MSFTIGAFTATTLLAQPLGYDEVDTRKGLTARKWQISGLFAAVEWQALLTEFDTWQAARFDDPDSIIANDVGTTVAFSGAANGITWSSVPCWFSTAPTGTQVGPYVSGSVEIVDAQQALDAAIKSEDKAKTDDRAELGNYTIGGVVLDLLKPVESYQDPPQLRLTAAGTHYVEGPIGATKLVDVSGLTDATGWTTIQSWYEAIVLTTPTAGSLYPASVPTASVELKIIGGLRVNEYTVNITLAMIR